jgi:hypothetical protein
MHYKANGTYQDGYQLQVMMAIRGIDAPSKARKTADALLGRTRDLLKRQGMADYSETCVELLGAESHYGPHARDLPTREVVLRIAARHAEPKGLVFLQRECASAGTSMGPGTRSSFSGRMDIQPVIKVFSFLVPKTSVALQVESGDLVESVPTQPYASEVSKPAALESLSAHAEGDSGRGGDPITVPLVALAWARSGDKGDDENIGVIARHPSLLPLLSRQLTAAAVADYFAHLVSGAVERFDVPGLHGLNFILHGALGGGGVASLRSDPLGKSYAQMLLDFPVQIPAAWLEQKHLGLRLPGADSFPTIG